MTRLAARHGLAEVLVAQKKHAEAEPHLLAVYRELARQPDADPAEVRPVVEWLVEVYAATGQAEQRAKLGSQAPGPPAGPVARAGRSSPPRAVGAGSLRGECPCFRWIGSPPPPHFPSLTPSDFTWIAVSPLSHSAICPGRSFPCRSSNSWPPAH